MPQTKNQKRMKALKRSQVWIGRYTDLAQDESVAPWIREEAKHKISVHEATAANIERNMTAVRRGWATIDLSTSELMAHDEAAFDQQRAPSAADYFFGE